MKDVTTPSSSVFAEQLFLAQHSHERPSGDGEIDLVGPCLPGAPAFHQVEGVKLISAHHSR